MGKWGAGSSLFKMIYVKSADPDNWLDEEMASRRDGADSDRDRNKERAMKRTDFGDQVDTAVKNMVNEVPVGHHVWTVCRQEMGVSVWDSEGVLG